MNPLEKKEELILRTFQFNFNGVFPLRLQPKIRQSDSQLIDEKFILSKNSLFFQFKLN
jgi:hypothetical protein